MSTPVILVIDDMPDRLDSVSVTLKHRYAGDYQIIAESSATAALRRLGELRDDATPVVLVLTAVFTTAGHAELLGQVRGLHPSARRVLLVPRVGSDEPSLRVPTSLLQDRSVALPVLEAMALGLVESYLPAPASPSDEGFHRGVSELLEEWAHLVPRDRPAVRIISDDGSPRSHEIRDLLGRNSIPYLFQSANSPSGRQALRAAKASRSPLPVLILHTGEILSDPANQEIAAAFGLSSLPAATVDVAIVGAGPAGLSAAVNTASEGLSTAVLEREAIGGQAGSSSLIRNYLGFPRGISGASLATRAFEQAWSFGASMSIVGAVNRLRPDGDGYTLDLATGAVLRARSVIIATGVSYRRLAAPGMDRLTGAGVYYGAISSEASAFGGQHVYIAGAANSAGQAAVNVARYAARVTILARGASLGARMSQYLVEQLQATANIDVRTTTEVVAADGHTRLETLTLTNRLTGSTDTVAASALLVLIGAVPHTDWIPDIARDERGFIVTGPDLERLIAPSSGRLPSETSMPGVFAAGDVRSGSIKRVASAVGEGAIAGASAVQYLCSAAVNHRQLVAQPR
jgi:thioredoxin reductase (NADPH)